MRQRLFAEGTTVSVAKSRMEIEKVLTRHKATSVASGWTPDGATIMFEAHGRRVRFDLHLKNEEREDMRRWRCLLFFIKAKFEALDSGLVTFDQEFLAHIVVPGKNETVGDWLGPQLAAAYERGAGMPKMLGEGR